ncbi:uncharacterized protein NPIL_42071 [Nephila pilipes]|uniref:Uncharacterized protein n=1 Tax=Nephila pilipes TaxID=299642 RepID=A0A8X6TYF9_NEPPI|nr:uncharacterized protein NPIL_42071 [Nephila pilipes]
MLKMFCIPINELHEISNAAELAEEFADDAPRWDDNASEKQQGIEMMSSTNNELDFLKFFDYVRPFIFEELQSKLEKKKAIKWYAVVQATLKRTTQENDVECITPHFRSNCAVELMENTIAEHLESAF